ncbi:sulfate respiration complex iron-sulfur protein HmcB [Desulfonatronospira sp.]|uniref:sulfate respiration complex iron-sulfur protein HmcB n=1 Tax=Desulfonatronospira sp. TaxID=1962951 RepID=UPI0025BA6BBF|nr:4Fe-4S dicluster domain-containing protein [Desulfonatronospira sp.]
MNRRKFLGAMGVAGLGVAGAEKVLAAEDGVTGASVKDVKGLPDSYAVLFDVTRCIGCRQCEDACNYEQHLPEPDVDFFDTGVFQQIRRTDWKTYTVVNQYDDKPPGAGDLYRKIQCMHCLEPACAHSCFVKAFAKRHDGAVTYDPNVCVGCRYCMMACPFNIPAYEYHIALDPLVTKCTFCEHRLKDDREPACVEICPTGAMYFSTREEVLKEARVRVVNNPDKYQSHIYGEHEMGGTNWIYISGVPFEDVGMRMDLGTRAAGDYTSGALGGVPLIASFWPVLLVGAYAISKRREKIAKEERDSFVSQIIAEAGPEAGRRLAERLSRSETLDKAAIEEEVRKALNEAAAKTEREDH